ncbi:MAG: TonB-dependent receptor [Gammaproteobacteria bacterium]|nr:TonB-dependent receptor [Gammaproteobacteria bacterium]
MKSKLAITNFKNIFFALFLSISLVAQDEQYVFEEIIVTAEKRDESLQDLSQAVTVLSSEDLDNRQISSFVDISAIAPGVNVAKNEGFKTVITIRGVGYETNQNAIATPSVSYHLDGIYIASPYSLQTEFMDLERIEVLRGPQGTLFGQNSTGGAINVITSAPSLDESTSYADVTFGDYSLLKTRTSFNRPINESVAVRASFITNKRDGFTDNLSTGQDLDDADSISARVRLLYQPSDTFRANFTAQIFDENRNGSAQKGLLDTTPNPRELRQDSQTEHKLEASLYSAVLEWDFDAYSIKSLTSYQEDDILVRRDNDRNDAAYLAPFAQLPSEYDPETNKQTTITHEFNIVSAEPYMGKLDWIAGFFYLDTEIDISIRERLDFAWDGFDPIVVSEVLAYGGDVGFISDSKPERESTSIYGQGTWNHSDTLRSVFGIRYTEDEVYSEVTNFFGRGGTDILSVDGSKVTTRIVIEKDLDDNRMVYASYSKGYKPGGSNLTYGREDVVAPIVVLPTFEEEVVDAYEFGIKAELPGGRTRINSAFFYYDYEGLQYQATDPELFEGGVNNIPESEIYGAEIELSTFITDSMILDASMSWIETEITADHFALDNVQSDIATNALLGQGVNQFSDQVQIARAAEITNVKGNELAKTPNFTANLSLTWQKYIENWGEMSNSLQYTYRGDFKHRMFNNPLTDMVPDYEVIDLVVGYIPNSNSDLKYEFVAKNLTDEDGTNARFTDVFGVGATGVELIGPRQIMLRVKLAF